MATSLVSTGVQFPNNSIQTTATSGGVSISTINLANPNTTLINFTSIPASSELFMLECVVLGSNAPTARYPYLVAEDSGGIQGLFNGVSMYQAGGASATSMTYGVFRYPVEDNTNILKMIASGVGGARWLIRFWYSGFFGNQHTYALDYTLGHKSSSYSGALHHGSGVLKMPVGAGKLFKLNLGILGGSDTGPLLVMNVPTTVSLTVF